MVDWCVQQFVPYKCISIIEFNSKTISFVIKAFGKRLVGLIYFYMGVSISKKFCKILLFKVVLFISIGRFS